jgi:hypothetical protein
MTVFMAWSDDVLVRYDSIASGATSIAMKYDSIAHQLDSIGLRIDSLVMHIDEMTTKKDSVDDLDRWRRVIFRHGWSINDTSIIYPPMLDFGVKTYRWLNHALNYYDSAYVVNPGKTSGKKWKIMLKNNNWIDFYSGHLSQWRSYVQLNSDVTSLFGFQICGMGLSFTYMINARDLLAGKFIRNRRLNFSFTTSRVFIEAYYRKNDQSTVHINRLGNWHGSKIFTGLKREGYGLDAYYIFNHTHYSQAAAYCFSKYQKRSSGSLLGGIYLSHQDVVMDMSTLDQDLKKYLPDNVTDYRFRYRDFGVMMGYGYSWVFHHGWLFNITAVPSIGYRHSFPVSIEGKKSLLSTNLNGRIALVRTAGNFFYAFTGSHEGHWYQSINHSFYNSYSNFDVTAGFRF